MVEADQESAMSSSLREARDYCISRLHARFADLGTSNGETGVSPVREDVIAVAARVEIVPIRRGSAIECEEQFSE